MSLPFNSKVTSPVCGANGTDLNMKDRSSQQSGVKLIVRVQPSINVMCKEAVVPFVNALSNTPPDGKPKPVILSMSTSAWS